MARGDVTAGTATLEQAAGPARSSQFRGDAKRRVAFAELDRIAKTSETDAEAAWVAWNAFAVPPGDPELARYKEEVGNYVAELRSIKLSDKGRCAELERLLSETPGVPKKAELRAICRARRADVLVKSGKTAEALAEGREAARLAPNAPQSRQLLVYLLSSRIDQLVSAGRCAEARPLIAEGRALAPKDPYFEQSAAYCAGR